MASQELLSCAYREAHNHLIETDKKRDQIILFFSAALAIYIGFVKDTIQHGCQASEGIVVTDVFMLLLSLCFTRILIWYGRWHRIYVAIIKTISLLATENSLL